MPDEPAPQASAAQFTISCKKSPPCCVYWLGSKGSNGLDLPQTPLSLDLLNQASETPYSGRVASALSRIPRWNHSGPPWRAAESRGCRGSCSPASRTQASALHFGLRSGVEESKLGLDRAST